jgi:hypothetical protein
VSFSLVLHVPPLSFERRRDRHGFHGAEDFLGDRRIDARTAEDQASPQPQH